MSKRNPNRREWGCCYRLLYPDFADIIRELTRRRFIHIPLDLPSFEGWAHERLTEKGVTCGEYAARGGKWVLRVTVDGHKRHYRGCGLAVLLGNALLDSNLSMGEMSGRIVADYNKPT